MASAKQIAWRKKFARMAKSGKFKKAIRNTKENLKIVREGKMKHLSWGTVKGYKKMIRAEKRKK